MMKILLFVNNKLIMKLILNHLMTYDKYIPSSLKAGRIFNTWVGDSSKVLLLEAVINTIKEYKLLETVQDTGDYLRKGLHEMEVREITLHSFLISFLSSGTFLLFCMRKGSKNE